jgi:hypothetical protein
MRLATIAAFLVLCSCEREAVEEQPPRTDAPFIVPPADEAPVPPTPAPPPPPAWTPIRLAPVGEPGFMVRPEPATFGPTLRLPEVLAYEVMHEGAPVAIAQDAVHFGDATVARIDKGALVVDDLQGHLLPRLLEPLTARRVELEEEAAARNEESTGTLVLFVERSTTIATVVDVLYTANRAGFREYQFAVDVGASGLEVGVALTVAPPKFTGPKKLLVKHPGVSVVVDHARVRIERDRRVLAELEVDHHDKADLAELANVARTQADAIALAPDQHATAVLVASPDVSIQRVLTVYSQLSGPDCVPSAMFAFDRTKCFFPLRVIEAGK